MHSINYKYKNKDPREVHNIIFSRNPSRSQISLIGPRMKNLFPGSKSNSLRRTCGKLWRRQPTKREGQMTLWNSPLVEPNHMSSLKIWKVAYGERARLSLRIFESNTRFINTQGREVVVLLLPNRWSINTHAWRSRRNTSKSSWYIVNHWWGAVNPRTVGYSWALLVFENNEKALRKCTKKFGL